MLNARYFTAAGEAGEPVQLPEELFDGFVHEAALHQTIKAYLANQRHGNASTKTRAFVSGGARKPWRQKGTGRARQGSIRAPHWRGGGIVFGPHPRSYRQDVPKKVRQLARRSAFSSRALQDQVVVIERFDFDAPKTSHMAELVAKMGGERRVLVLTQGSNEKVVLSARNLPDVDVMPMALASAYDVLRAKLLVIEADALRPAGAAQEAEVANA
ncbi:MAG TPA: 50S ribosomal protein L4 [Longimicrobiaceae bacterium]|jgi:large subunit ribosomal protein L4|nr:50S ribosomal protein L4 [Longimicrobiaceae bacterium]